MAELKPLRGLYFEEYTVGDGITSQGRTVTEGDIVNFAMLSGDWNPLHTDAEAAKATPYGERIAHGLLVLSMATGLTERLGILNQTVLGFMGLDWEFRAAVKIGDTIRVCDHLRVEADATAGRRIRHLEDPGAQSGGQSCPARFLDHPGQEQRRITGEYRSRRRF